MLPSVERYIERLPHGLESFPRALIKGAVVRSMVLDSGVTPLLGPGQVAPVVDDLVRSPPAVGTWIPEAHFGALLHAIFDLKFREAGGVPAFEAWTLDCNRKLLRGPIYKVMFLMAKPERLFSGAPRRWATFHRGSIMTLLERGESGARVRLTYPAHVFGDLGLRSVGTAFQAACEAAGALDLRMSHRSESDTTSVYEAKWR